MKTLILAAIAALGLIGCSSSKSEPRPTPQTPAAKKSYACPMNCVTSDRPGDCPKCGMAMVEVKKDAPARTGASGKTFACPMNCATSDRPGECPKCGMEMVEVKPGTPAKKDGC